MEKQKVNAQMAHIYQQIIQMGDLVEKALQKSLEAMRQHDKSLARQVIEQDRQIDEYQTAIEDLCTALIATKQPVASDLREVVTLIKVVSDLERIGDHARHLAKTVTTVGRPLLTQVWPIVEGMTVLGIDMVHDALTALVNGDVDLARTIAQRDSDMDKQNNELHRLLLTIMKQSPDLIDEAINLVFVNRLLERLGDHVFNMCDWINYARQGRRFSSP